MYSIKTLLNGLKYLFILNIWLLAISIQAKNNDELSCFVSVKTSNTPLNFDLLKKAINLVDTNEFSDNSLASYGYEVGFEMGKMILSVSFMKDFGLVNSGNLYNTYFSNQQTSISLKYQLYKIGNLKVFGDLMSYSQSSVLIFDSTRGLPNIPDGTNLKDIIGKTTQINRTNKPISLGLNIVFKLFDIADNLGCTIGANANYIIYAQDKWTFSGNSQKVKDFPNLAENQYFLYGISLGITQRL